MKFATLSITLNEVKVIPRVILKNSYLSDLSSMLDGFKLIENLFQRSTTSLLMIRSNFIYFEDELMVKGKNFCFKKKIKTHCIRLKVCIRKSIVGLPTSSVCQF